MTTLESARSANAGRRLIALRRPTIRQRLACFDVFDTALVRTVVAPSDVFRLIHARLREQAPEVLTEWDEDSFVVARRRAEQLARSTCGHEECTLEEIWAALTAEVPELSAIDGAAIELDVERDCLTANGHVAELLREARLSATVAFVSDTYLPRWFVHEVLERESLLEEADLVYTSSETRVQKRSGRLYEYIMKDTNLGSNRITMIGDDRHADTEMPSRLGVAAVPYREGLLTPVETKVAQIPRLSRSALSAIMRLDRLSCPNSAEQRLVSQYLGPVSMAWSIWALRQASSSGVDRLYFLSRDAFLAWRCSKTLSPTFNVDCRYLMISRYAALSAGTRGLTEQDLHWLVQPDETPTTSRLLRRLDATLDECDQGLRRWAARLEGDARLGPDDLEEFFRTLEEPRTKAHLLERFERRRNTLLSYLEQEGLFDPAVPWAVVEPGWRATIQQALHALVQPEGSARGLYVYLSDQRSPPRASGPTASMLPLAAPDARSSATVPALFRWPFVFEHVFGLAPHGTVLGHHEGAEGWAGTCQAIAEDDRRWRSGIQARIDAFAQRNAATFLRSLDTAERCAEFFTDVTTSFMEEPDPSVLECLTHHVKLSSDLHNDDAEVLARPYGATEVVRSTLPRFLFGSPLPARKWRPACLALSAPHVRLALKLKEVVRQEFPRRDRGHGDTARGAKGIFPGARSS